MADETNGFPTNKIKIVELNNEVKKEIHKNFIDTPSGYIRVGEPGYFLFDSYKKMADIIYNIKPRPDDTWVVTFPRSGTTMTQELTWLIANDLDFESATAISLPERFPNLESNMYRNNDGKLQEEKIKVYGKPIYEIIETMPSPRFIKTHLPLCLLPPSLLHSGAKVIYVARNTKSVVSSYYHFCLETAGILFEGNLQKFWELYKKNQILFTPHLSHIEEAWRVRKNKNVLFIFYEDIIKDMKSYAKRVMDFYGKSYTEDQIDLLMSHMSIENFKKNPSVNASFYGKFTKWTSGFIGSGQIKDWSNFTPELIDEVDEWLSENIKKTEVILPKF